MIIRCSCSLCQASRRSGRDQFEVGSTNCSPEWLRRAAGLRSTFREGVAEHNLSIWRLRTYRAA